MSRVTMEVGGNLTVVYHSVDDRTHLETELTAVVAWRHGRVPQAGWRARLKRWQFRWGFHPLTRRISIGRDAGLWYGSAGTNGEQATMFHPMRRVVRALDREYMLAPRGMTLVLLIDEIVPSPSVRELQIPAARLPRTAAQLDAESGNIRDDALRDEPEAWRAVLRMHQDIADFLTREAL